MIFSVIVPFFNEEKHIEKCVRSLLGQDFDHEEYELIFIDNNSTDRSAEIIRKFPGIQLLQEHKQNSYAARNRGLQVAKGRMMAFTDADCAVATNWLSSILKGVDEKGADIVLGKRYFPENSSFAAKVFQDYENAKIEYCLDRLPREKFFGYTNNMAVKAEVFRNNGIFGEDVPILGDGDFIHRVVRKNTKLKIAYLPDMTITHLEVNEASTWLRKVGSYGRDMPILKSKNKDYLELSFREKIGIYDAAIKANNYGFFRSLLGLSVLAAGDIFYRAGKAGR